MDVLSQVLKFVTLKAAVFYNGEFSAPWSFHSLASSSIRHYLGHPAGNVIIYHLLTEGNAWVCLEGGERVQLTAGDIALFPHGHAHLMGNGAAVEPVDIARELGRILAQGVTVSRMGGGGEITKVICGYLMSDTGLSRLVLAGLPPLVTLNIREDSREVGLEGLIRFSVENAHKSDAGGEAVLAKLSEALFVETLRRYIALMPPADVGWLAGARDAEVGRALALLHEEPARRWTIADLAAAAGVSRAVLAERFQHFVGEPPIGYLTRLRLQMAARLLTTTNHSVAEIAAQVGYDSEAAFNRAFRRMFDAPPARFRRDARLDDTRSRGVRAG